MKILSMVINVKYNITDICEYVLKLQLDKMGLNYEITSFNQFKLKNNLNDDAMLELTAKLGESGIDIIENQKSITVQKIKDAITEMIHTDNAQLNHKSSVYLAEKLNHSYNYLSNLFSEITFTSIENYIIIQKIERVKQLLLVDELSLTEIAYNLNYSSVAHLCSQFKKTTGLTSSAFQNIMKKRNKN